jgi:putative transposase
MRTVLTHRIELKPNKLQEARFRQCVGASRLAYNWALAEWQRQFEAGEKPNEAALRRQFNAIKPIEFPWILDLPKSVPQQAIKNVGRAYQRFFQKNPIPALQAARRPRLGPAGQRPWHLRF